MNLTAARISVSQLGRATLGKSAAGTHGAGSPTIQCLILFFTVPAILGHGTPSIDQETTSGRQASLHAIRTPATHAGFINSAPTIYMITMALTRTSSLTIW